MARSALTGATLAVAAASMALATGSARADEAPVAPTQSEPAAGADTKKQCVSDYESGQRARNASNFVIAKKHFLACAQALCPAIVRKDCAQWLSEVGQASPTVVVAAQHAGVDITGVRVYVDGDLLTDGLDGRAREVNPGRHTFRFEAEGFDTSEQVVLVREGEHNRRVGVSLRRPGEVGDGDGIRVHSDPVSHRKDVPVLSYILGGVGVVGGGVFAGFGLRGMNLKSDLDKLACKPDCDPAKTSVIKRDFLIADIGLAVGVASLGTAAILLFTRGYTPGIGAKMRIDVAPLQGGGAAWLSGRF